MAIDSHKWKARAFRYAFPCRAWERGSPDSTGPLCVRTHDGSTDGSRAIISQYQKKYEEIVLIDYFYFVTFDLGVSFI